MRILVKPLRPLLLLLCWPALAGGAIFDFDFYPAGAKANGLGGAFVSLADDSTALSWNQAGIVRQTSPVLCYLFDSQFSLANPRDLLAGFKVTYDAPALLSFIYPFNDRYHSTFAFSAQTPIQRKKFSSGRNYYVIQAGPSYAMMFFDKLALGAGASLMVSQEPLLKRWGAGFGIQAGLLYLPSKFFRFGVSVRPPFTVRWNSGSQTVRFPGDYQAGATVRLNRRTTASLEVEYQHWSAFRFLDASGTNRAPRLREGLGYTVLPHFGIQYQDRKSGANIRFGLENRSFFDKSTGSLLPQYHIGFGIGGRALKIVDIEASLVDSYLLHFFNREQQLIETLQLTIEYNFN